MYKQQLLLIKQYQDRIDELQQENAMLKRDYLNVIKKMKKMKKMRKKGVAG
ncbi:hypothetical protein [Bacillus weihaiensis]|uniref:hypothetical protein n=1 Tax=Bacillus weihaiensis TaxID=1547283 RepID=UPI0023532783|nr:hypothetical protein [Bacillus weihaiensis]